jgi:hypothetical protein
MKKLLFISVTTLFVTLSQAQETSFGIKGGVNVSKVDHDPGADFDSKVGAHLGGLAHIHISNQFAVQPEIMFSMQGGERGSTKAKLNYINVPVMAQFMFGNGFRVQTGPQVGFMVSAKHDNGDLEIDVSDQLETIDFAWSFGAGYLFPGGIGIDARYNYGLTNIYENNTIEQKNRVFQFGLFYQFTRGKATTKK